MRKMFFMSLLAGMVLAGCSNNDLPEKGGESEGGETRYMAVNIVTTPNGGGRAAGDQHSNENPDNNSTYEEGKAEENKVKNARFYFFNDQGKDVSINTENTNYVDKDLSNDSKGENTPNVEKIVEAVLVLQTKNVSSLPTKMAVVVNPNTTTLGTTSLSLDNLLGIIEGNKFTTPENENLFIMSSSVYAKNSQKQVAVSIDKDINYQPNEEKAKTNAVNVYVERTVAKVRLYSSITTNSITYTNEETTHTIYKTNQKYGTEDIYVEFLGWNITAEANQSYLFKKIKPEWSATLFGKAPSTTGAKWNCDPFFRSFWAVNPSNGTTYSHENDFEDAQLHFVASEAGDKTAGSKTNYAYCRENAATELETGKKQAGTNTQVIIAARLVKSTGEALEIAEYGANKCTVEDLKKYIISGNSLNLYYEDETNGTEIGGKKYSQIKPEDIDFKTAFTVAESGSTLSNVSNRYYVYAQLSTTGKQKTWYKKTNESTVTEVEANAVNETLKDTGSYKIWKGGNTYYYFDIEHLAATHGNGALGEAARQEQPGWYGVVRNHIYDVNIKSLTGLGTPVYNPDEIIIPEKPVDGETYIAAQINILSWRVVNNNVDLVW